MLFVVEWGAWIANKKTLIEAGHDLSAAVKSLFQATRLYDFLEWCVIKISDLVAEWHTRKT